MPRVWRRGGAGAVSYDHLQPSARLQAATAIINIDLATAHAQLPRPGHTIIPPPTADMLLCPAHKSRIVQSRTGNQVDTIQIHIWTAAQRLCARQAEVPLAAPSYEPGRALPASWWRGPVVAAARAAAHLMQDTLLWGSPRAEQLH